MYFVSSMYIYIYLDMFIYVHFWNANMDIRVSSTAVGEVAQKPENIPLIVVCSSLLCRSGLCCFLDQSIVQINGLRVKEKSTQNPVLISKK